MGNLDGGTFAESGIITSSSAGSSCSSNTLTNNTAEIEQQIEYDREQHEKKFAAPAYKEIRTRKNGLKANNGVTMNGNGIKVNGMCVCVN